MVSGERVIDIGKLAEERFGDLHVMVECVDETILEIFDEEVKKAGLEHLDMDLITPELPLEYLYCREYVGDASKIDEGVYGISIALPPGGLSELGENIFLPFEPNFMKKDYNGQFRSLLRHELGHIKMGHTDYSGLFGKIYYCLVGEPAAHLYAALGDKKGFSFLFKKIV